MQDITLIRNSGRDANAERGARFHPTVGSVIPTGFTTSHPRARPRCFETQSPASSSTEVKDEGYSPSPLFMTLCIFGVPLVLLPRFLSRALLLSPPPFHTSFLAFFLQGCVWHEFPCPWSGLRASTDGRFTPIPSFTLEEPPHLPSWRVIHSGVRE
jgi:hypothetical protein